MRTSVVVVLTAWLLLASSSFVAVSGTRAATTPPRPMGGFVDSMLWSAQPSEAQALLDLQSGALDVYAYPLKTAGDILSAHQNPNLRTIDSFGTEDNLFVNPVPVNQSLAPGVFNPFAVPEIRQALNYLLDRDYINAQIFGGYGAGHSALWNPASPEAARDPFFFHDLNRQYGYNYSRAHDMVFAALNASGATYSNGNWSWQGHPIVVNIVQRVEDQRFQIGQYVASQIQTLGLQANLIPKSGGGAFQIVYNGPPDTGAWMLYTEGWAYTGLVRWPDEDLDFFYNGGEGSTIWYTAGGPYHPPQELSDIAVRLRDRNYSSVEDRQRLVERGQALALNESVRVWLVASETQVYSDRVTNVVTDLNGGLWSPFSMRTARFSTPGGTLHVGNRVNFVSPWQPWQGFAFLYDWIVRDTFSDPGVAVHPHTGAYIPIRAEFESTTAGPNGSLAVPPDAQVYNPSSGAWEAVAPGTNARSEVTFNYTFGNWHHGPAMDMNDVLYDVALIARRAAGDVAAHDPDALDAHDRAFASMFRGLRVVDSDTLEVYVDFWHPDPSFIAAAADVWPRTPWEVGELAMLTTLHDHTRVSEATASIDGLDVIDLTKGNTVGFMDNEIASGNVTTSGPGVTRPAGFSGLISQADAEARWSSLQTWRANKLHYFPSNGPFYLDTLTPSMIAANQAQVTNDPNYPFPATRWDDLLQTPVPSLSISPIADVVIGDPAQVHLTTDVAGQPYDNATVLYRIIEPAHETVLQTGQAVRSGPGAWDVDLLPAFTANLSEGTYRFEAAATSTEASLTTYANRTFNVTSSTDIVPPTSAIDALPSYWIRGGPFVFQVTATDDKSGVALVEIHQAFSADGTDWSTPVVVGNASSPPFAFSISPSQGDGRYRFWSIARDAAGNVESLAAKSPTGDAESGLDTATPLSALGPPTGYWQPSTPLSVSSIASDDGSGLASVQLFASYSADGVSWTAPASVGTRTSGPFEFTFGWTMGEGRYRFWSIATDVAGNVEAIGGKPTTGEFEVGVDSVAPTATLASLPSYWQTGLAISVQATVSEATSGVAAVDLYVSETSDGVSWTVPAKVATDTTTPFGFTYTATHDGRYRLWALATDRAGNVETVASQPANGEVAFGIDRAAPSATVQTPAQYWHRAGPLALDVTASDDLSGVSSVALYVSFSSDGVSWSTPTLAATNSLAPFSFSYSPDHGDGTYRFWAVATDAAGNAEVLGSPPGAAEAEIGVDSIAPTILSSVPADGTTGVAGTTIRITFSEAVDHAAAESRFSIAPSVAGSVSWDGNTLVFTASQSLAPETTYRVAIRSGVPDPAGNALGADYSISFATAGPIVAGPSVLSENLVIGLGAIAIATVVAVALLLRRRSARKDR